MRKDIQYAIFIAKKLFAELVYDVQALEGMPFSMPEVQTYLQGITVGGHKVADEEKLKQQALGWKKLISSLLPARYRRSSPRMRPWRLDSSAPVASVLPGRTINRRSRKAWTTISRS